MSSYEMRTSARIKRLLLAGTSTLWKITEYAAISLMDSTGGILTLPLSYLKPHHSPVEDKITAEANLSLKIDEVADAADTFREGQGRAGYEQALITNDIRFVDGNILERTYAVADDTTMAMTTALWLALLPKLKKLVVSSALKASPCDIEGDDDEYISVADIGPITSAIGQVGFFALLRQTALEVQTTAEQQAEQYATQAIDSAYAMLSAGQTEGAALLFASAAYAADKAQQPAKIYNQVSCAITCLGDPKDAPAKVFKAHTLLNLYAPNGLAGEVPVASPIPTTEDFVCLPGRPDQPVSGYYRSYLLNHGSRQKIYAQIKEWILGRESESRQDSTAMPANVEPLFTQAAIEETRTARRKPRAKFKVVQPTIGAIEINGVKQKSIGGLPLLSIPTGIQLPLQQNVLNTLLSAEFNLGKTENGQPVFEHADVFILPPFDPSDEKALAYNNMIFDSIMVAKALDRRYHNVRVIAMNLNGCWDGRINAHIARANNGYNKAFVLHPVHNHLAEGERIVTQANVDYLPLVHLDVLSGNDQEDLAKAAEQVLNFALPKYHRIDSDKQPAFRQGHERPENMFSVAVFASASSDKLVDYRNGVMIGRILGKLCDTKKQGTKLGAALCTGGGDQHLMVAPVAGYNKSRKKGSLHHLKCVSTHEIVLVETIHGRLPTCDRAELYATIGPRLESLMKNDLFISIGGGDGTGQETGLVLYMKTHTPELVRDKQIMFIGNNPAMLAEIRSSVGDAALHELQKDPYALADKGIYLFPDAQAAAPAIRRTHDEHYERVIAPVTRVAQQLKAALVA